MDFDGLLGARNAVYRGLGHGDIYERIGVGLADKSGHHIDEAGGSRPTYSLVHVLRGCGSYRDAQGRTYAIVPGCSFLRRPGVPHHLSIDPESRWLECWVDLGPMLYQTLVRLGCLRGLPESWAGAVDSAAARRCRRLIDRLGEAGEHDLPALMAEILALHADLVVAGRQTESSDHIEAACRFLADPARRQLSLRAYCGERDLGYERFRKHFTRSIGCSPERYRIRRRIERACQMLETSDLSVAAIAERLGYSSAFDFSAQFRHCVGRPPSRYRGQGHAS